MIFRVAGSKAREFILLGDDHAVDKESEIDRLALKTEIISKGFIGSFFLLSN